MKASPKVDPKPVLDLPDPSCGAYYVVGGGVQDVLGGVVMHDEGVVMGEMQIIGTSYYGEVLVVEYGLQHLQNYWSIAKLFNFLTTLLSRSSTSCMNLVLGPCKGV